ncbi:MAG: class I SAM-dependent rRNA methyltransferase [Leptospiraceae bacterium]|nr:class I SAM-dependent rRNA methyltransferase [Leptospiraceae bacterium]
MIADTTDHLLWDVKERDTKNNMPVVYIKPSVGVNISAGHPWVFSGGIAKSAPNLADGELVRIYSDKRFIGIGYHNSASDIRLRVLTWQDREINTDFFVQRFQEILARKAKLTKHTDAFRLVFGESDFLPGLVIDIYKSTAVIQIHSLGMEKLKPMILSALKKVIKLSCIHEKSELSVRTREGLDKEVNKTLFGELDDEIIIQENNFKFAINIAEGQKTGFFLDQRENRKALLEWCNGRKVLNCFSYTGGFSVYAASRAQSVTSVDISKPAISAARRNFELNGYLPNDFEFIAEDVFEYLKNLSYGKFDLIILDPPSFAKNRSQVKNAIKAYITINSKALEKLPDNGLLVSSSCTTHIDEITFVKILHQSAVHAKCRLVVLESRVQPADHPYLLSFPEGRYLKYFVLQKIAIP